MLTMVLRTSPWSKSSSDTFVADDGSVLSHTRFSDSFIPDFFSSMQNLYTFSIIAPASSLYLHTSLAILLNEVALHVHNTSKNAFFCKHVYRLTFPASLRKQKKKKFYWSSNPQPWARILNFESDSLSTTVIPTAPSNRL